MSETLNGAEFVALCELTTADVVVAVVGETCERVPASSLPWLIRAGRIQRVTAAVKPAAATPPVRARAARKAKE